MNTDGPGREMGRKDWEKLEEGEEERGETSDRKRKIDKNGHIGWNTWSKGKG
jgi:hypothetical protein